MDSRGLAGRLWSWWGQGGKGGDIHWPETPYFCSIPQPLHRHFPFSRFCQSQVLPTPPSPEKKKKEPEQPEGATRGTLLLGRPRTPAGALEAEARPAPGNRMAASPPQPFPTPPGGSQMLADGRTESAETSLQKRKVEPKKKKKIQTLLHLRGKQRRREGPGLGLPVPSAV